MLTPSVPNAIPLPLTDGDVEDLILGAKQGTVLYLRMVDWALENDSLTLAASDHRFELASGEMADISGFSMSDLELEN